MYSITVNGRFGDRFIAEVLANSAGVPGEGAWRCWIPGLLAQRALALPAAPSHPVWWFEPPMRGTVGATLGFRIPTPSRGGAPCYSPFQPREGDRSPRRRESPVLSAEGDEDVHVARRALRCRTRRMSHHPARRTLVAAAPDRAVKGKVVISYGAGGKGVRVREGVGCSHQDKDKL